MTDPECEKRLTVIEGMYMHIKKTVSTNENAWTVIMMGVAAVSMVLHHFGGTSFLLLDLFFHVDVLVFFYLAGYSYAASAPSDESKRQLYKSRTIRHLKVYFGISMLLLLIYLAIWHFSDHSLSFSRILKACGGILYARAGIFYPYFDASNQIYLFQISNGALWFIPAMILGEGILLIYFKAKASKKSGMDLLLILGLIISGFVLKMPGILLPWSIDTAPYIALIMIAGYEIAPVNLIREGKIGKTTLIVTGLALALYIFMVYADPGYNLSIREYGNFRFSMVFSLLCGILGCVLLSEACKVLSRFAWFSVLAWIGKNALGIVGFHCLFIDMLPVIANKTAAELSVIEAAGLLAGIIIILGGLSFFVFKIGESIQRKKKSSAV